MGKIHTLVEHLRKNLTALLDKTHTPAQLNEVVMLSHAIAVTFLEGKAASGSLNREFFHLPIEDAAYDCIADLFRRDETNSFIALNAYFSAFDISTLDSTELFPHLRRLVFTKVNDGIARSYHDSDPMLSRIIRNVRLAVHSLGNYTEIERFGEVYLAPTLCDPLEHLPKFDEQTLEHLLAESVRGNENVLEIVGTLARKLRVQNEYARMVSVLQVALTIRSLYARKAMLATMEGEITQKHDERVVKETMHSAINRIQHRFYLHYVGNGKTNDATYGVYFDVITTRLEYMLLSGSADGQSLYSSLKNRLPGLSVEDYKEHHRSRLEYLFKLTCDEVAKEIRK
ncbi:MAG: hypothetical protein HYV29_14000 [Ignavibacteriales bacterium]|nr:hypothetical protein [Ignavibacteriales bacterium]